MPLRFQMFSWLVKTPKGRRYARPGARHFVRWKSSPCRTLAACKTEGYCVAAGRGGGHRREEPVCKMMNSIRLHILASHRRNGEASQLTLSVGAFCWQQSHLLWSGKDESGPASARYSEALSGRICDAWRLNGSKSDGHATWGDLGGGLNSESDVSPGAGFQHSTPRSRSPHSSDDLKLAKLRRAKEGRKMDRQQPEYQKEWISK